MRVDAIKHDITKLENCAAVVNSTNYFLSDGAPKSVNHAIHVAAERRMRPIFLTSAAASMGVVPMILGGSGLWMPMGAVICYGTLITMLLILTVMPIAYWKVMGRSE